MRARDLLAAFPTITVDTPVLEAARLLAEQDLPGLIVVDESGRPLARLVAHMARNSNTPVCRSTQTMIIMPSSRKITFQSMPVYGE